MSDDMWVYDRRFSGKRMGPYSPADARKLAADLNSFVQRNRRDGDKGPPERPFEAR